MKRGSHPSRHSKTLTSLTISNSLSLGVAAIDVSLGGLGRRRAGNKELSAESTEVVERRKDPWLFSTDLALLYATFLSICTLAREARIDPDAHIDCAVWSMSHRIPYLVFEETQDH